MVRRSGGRDAYAYFILIVATIVLLTVLVQPAKADGYPEHDVKISLNQTECFIPCIVYYVDVTVGDAAGWCWSFKNTTPGNNTWVEFSHVLGYWWEFGTGNFTWELTQFNGTAWNTSLYTYFLNVSYPPAVPNVSFISNHTGGQSAPRTIQFNDTSGPGYPDVILEWNWTFVDVTGNNTEIKFSSLKNPSKTFNVGNFSIFLNASNLAGGNKTEYPKHFINLSLSYLPITNFTTNITEGNSPAAVQFTDTSGNEPYYWIWTFRNVTGNNTEIIFNSTSPNPIKRFGLGNFSIVLYSSNGAGTNNSPVDSYFINVSVPSQPIAAFTQNVTTGMVSYWGERVAVQFNDTSANAPTSWNWSYKSSDGDVNNNSLYVFSYSQNPIWQFGYGHWLIYLNATNWLGSNTSPPSTLSVSEYQVQVQQQQYFTSKKVRFMCQDYLGIPIVGMNVTAIGVESSLGSIDWIPKLFGINLNETPILDTQMVGTTGTDGGVNFVMIETERYQLHYELPSKGIDEYRYYYPKEESYLEIFWTESTLFAPPTIPPCGAPTYTASVTINGTNADYDDIHLTYSDCSGHTTNTTVYVNDISDNKVKQQLYTNNSPTPNNVSLSYPVRNATGASYRFGVTGRTVTGTPFHQESTLKLKTSIWKYNPLNAENGDPFAVWFYNIIAVGLIILFALFFGRWSIKAGVVIIPLIALYFSELYMNWLLTPALLVTVAVILAVLAYLRFAEEEAQL